MSELETVLTELRGLRSDVREDQGKIWDKIEKLDDADKEAAKCRASTKLKIEKQNGRIHNLEAKNREAREEKKAVKDHINDPVIHFDKAKAQETGLGYLAKKKILAIVLTALAVLAAGITTWLLNGLPVPGG